MLTMDDLGRTDDELATRVLEEVAGLETDRDAPEELRDLAILFELDHQVRNGGFAQYFFNASCDNAFDAWFATEQIDPLTHDLLSDAIHRIGVGTDENLDLHAVMDAGGGDALGEAYRILLTIRRDARAASGTLFDQFAAFRDRFTTAIGEVPGFEALQTRFFAETDLPRAIVAHVRANPETFVDGA